MEIILKKDVESVGYRDDVVTVKDGYGRNFLIPQGYAILATEAAKKMHSETLKQRSHKQTKLQEEAEAIATKLEGAKIVVAAKVGEKGKIFGSVSSVQVSEALKKAGFDIERKSISIKNEPVKEVGTYEADIILFKNVKRTISFEVAGE